MPDSPTLTVLHGLRLGSVLDTGQLSTRSGLHPDEVAAVLDSAAQRGWVRHSSGRLTGWSLTRTGRLEGERLLAAQLDASGIRPVVTDAHERFVPLNVRFLAVCTDWQVRRSDGAEAVNDHSDEAHDLGVLERLAHIHAAARPLLAHLSTSLERFAGYQPRLELALERVLGGDSDWLTRPTIDSYHTVWFELHEDLLATLGRRRSDDTPTNPGSPAGLLEEHV